MVGTSAPEHSVTLRRVNLTDNVSTSMGGAIAIDGSSLKVHGLHCVRNVAGGNVRDVRGGCMYLAGSDAQLIDLYLGHNSANGNGGAVAVSGTSTRGDTDVQPVVTMQRATFAANFASGCGGAISVFWAQLHVVGVTALNNKAAELGGVLCVNDDADVTISGNVSMAGNGALDGGAVYCSGSNFKINASGVEGNQLAFNAALRGGAATFIECDATMSGVALHDNTADYGGAASFVASSGHFTNCTVTRNEASSIGGAVHAMQSHISIVATTASNNSAQLSGGVVALEASSLDMTRVVALDNQAGRYGGAVFLADASSRAALFNCRFEGNSAPGGGAVAANAGTLTVRDSQFRRNKAFTALGGAILYTLATDALIAGVAYSDNEGGAVVQRPYSTYRGW